MCKLCVCNLCNAQIALKNVGPCSMSTPFQRLHREGVFDGQDCSLLPTCLIRCFQDAYGCKRHSRCSDSFGAAFHTSCVSRLSCRTGPRPHEESRTATPETCVVSFLVTLAFAQWNNKAHTECMSGIDGIHSTNCVWFSNTCGRCAWTSSGWPKGCAQDLDFLQK